MATLRGYAIVTDVLSEDLGFRERITRKAVERALARNPDVFGLVDHDFGKVIGRSSAGTLRLRQDQQGLMAEIDVAPTTAGGDVIASVQRRDTRGMSFGFIVPKGGDDWSVEGDTLIRTITDLKLLDVTVTPVPAYPQTSVAIAERARPRYVSEAQMQLNRLRLRLNAT